MKNRSKSLIAKIVQCAFVGIVVTQSFDKRLSAQNAVASAHELTESLNADLALTKPDQFNWILFVSICTKAPDESQPKAAVNGQETKSNNALWETWADDPFTFPQNPQPSNPPKWADRNKQKTLQAIGGLELLLSRRRHVVPTPSDNTPEEVRRNEQSFNYIIENNLFFQEGLAKAFAQGVNAEGYPSGKVISFPAEAVEVKADWAPITENSLLNKNNCHWNYDSKGKLWGLVGFHIMSKILPNWTWATFEWVGNPVPEYADKGAPGRSDWIGSRDQFGVKYSLNGSAYFQAPIFVNGNVNRPSNKSYPGGTITPELAELFRNAGYAGEWLNEWSNYRLKGSQTNFTDASGQASILGNSAIEGSVGNPGINNTQVKNSSCITCHGISNVSKGGSPGTGPSFIVGSLNPGLFYDLNSFDPTQPGGSFKVINYQMDFVWSFLFAKPQANP